MISRQVADGINDVVFSPDIVLIKLKRLKSKLSHTPDHLPPIIFKELSDVLAEPLSLLFTRSFEEGEVPSIFRESIVNPIHKKGARSLAENYRPIAQESIICLIMESIIADAIFNYLSVAGLLDPSQHGFTKGKSTATQLLEAAHDWALAKNHRNPLHCVYFDFSRAFDRVDHDLLMAKMASLGIGPRLIRWCRAYLTDRSFKVKVGNSISTSAYAPSGVPQGSCIGPLLYAIFCQDLKRLFDGVPIQYKVYADDLKIYMEIKKPMDRHTLQEAINLVSLWATVNKMVLSTPKCALIKTMPDDHIYLLDGAQIPCVQYYKDLGIIFDRELKFRQHIVESAQMTSRMCNLLMRSFIVSVPEFYIKLYNTIIVPKWLYCSQVWAPFTSVI